MFSAVEVNSNNPAGAPASWNQSVSSLSKKSEKFLLSRLTLVPPENSFTIRPQAEGYDALTSETSPSCRLCRSRFCPPPPSRLRRAARRWAWRRAPCSTRRPRRSSRSPSCWGWRRRSGPGSCPCTPGWTRAATTAGRGATCPAGEAPPGGDRNQAGWASQSKTATQIVLRKSHLMHFASVLR